MTEITLVWFLPQIQGKKNHRPRARKRPHIKKRRRKHLLAVLRLTQRRKKQGLPSVIIWMIAAQRFLPLRRRIGNRRSSIRRRPTRSSSLEGAPRNLVAKQSLRAQQIVLPG